MLRSSAIFASAGVWGAFAVALVASCTGSDTSGLLHPTSKDAAADQDQPVMDGAVEDRPVIPYDDASMPPQGTFCSLPGSIVSTSSGLMIIPGEDDASAPDPMTLTWLDVPVGFCAHFFAQVPEVRQLRFAPGGDLFAASPTAACTGGASGGLGAILVLPDDNHDGVADSLTPFLSGATTPSQTITSTQGLAFAGGYFYFQDGTTIRRVPFKSGDRVPSGPVMAVTTFPATIPQASEHWPKMLDFAQDGTLYVTNGSTQGQECVSPASSSYAPVFGAVFEVNAGGSLSEVTKGFRNPIALRCEPDHNVCLVAELGLDGSGGNGGREKLVPVRQGDDWGFPCCATQGTPYSGVTFLDTGKPPDCSGVAPENVSFQIGNTPFGIDFEPRLWPAPWTGRVFVTLHGDVGSWIGARIVSIALDPTTGLLLPASDVANGSSNSNDMLDFATGWAGQAPTYAGGQQSHGRPAPIAFAPDGRMFVGDDIQGLVAWIAPVALTPR